MFYSTDAIEHIIFYGCILLHSAHFFILKLLWYVLNTFRRGPEVGWKGEWCQLFFSVSVRQMWNWFRGWMYLCDRGGFEIWGIWSEYLMKNLFKLSSSEQMVQQNQSVDTKLSLLSHRSADNDPLPPNQFKDLGLCTAVSSYPGFHPQPLTRPIYLVEFLPAALLPPFIHSYRRAHQLPRDDSDR